MSSITQVLTSINEVIHPLGEVIGGLLTGIFIGILGVAKKRKYFLNMKQDKNTKFKEKHSQIHELLTELRLLTRSSRCLIFQYHNGGSFADGTSIKRFSVTHESVSVGIESMILESQDVLLTRYMELLHIIEKTPCEILKVDSLVESSLSSSLIINNVVSFCVCPLKCIDNITPMGFLYCHWCNEQELVDIKEEGIEIDTLQSLIENKIKNINAYLTHNTGK